MIVVNTVESIAMNTVVNTVESIAMIVVTMIVTIAETERIETPQEIAKRDKYSIYLI
jgi:hypothetical protein